MDASWDAEKSAELKRRHGIGFEDIVLAIESGGLLGLRNHPNQTDYGHQTQLIVKIDGYAYVVPAVTGSKGIFFKTLYPSRKATALFLRKGEN